jgi:hypothetical protein
MSSLWTPEGEHPVDRESQAATPGPGSAPEGPGAPGTPGASGGPDRGPKGGPDRGPGRGPEGGPQEETSQAELDELRRQLAETPVEIVVVNHAFGLFELAALHLSLQPPQLQQASLAIDAVAALTEGLAGRLGDAEPTLREGLAQLRLAFVQIKAVAEAAGAAADPE